MYQLRKVYSFRILELFLEYAVRFLPSALINFGMLDISFGCFRNCQLIVLLLRRISSLAASRSILRAISRASVNDTEGYSPILAFLLLTVAFTPADTIHHHPCFSTAFTTRTMRERIMNHRWQSRCRNTQRSLSLTFKFLNNLSVSVFEA